jgi:hypothetical protein
MTARWTTPLPSRFLFGVPRSACPGACSTPPGPIPTQPPEPPEVPSGLSRVLSSALHGKWQYGVGRGERSSDGRVGGRPVLVPSIGGGTTPYNAASPARLASSFSSTIASRRSPRCWVPGSTELRDCPPKSGRGDAQRISQPDDGREPWVAHGSLQHVCTNPPPTRARIKLSTETEQIHGGVHAIYTPIRLG